MRQGGRYGSDQRQVICPLAGARVLGQYPDTEPGQTNHAQQQFLVRRQGDDLCRALQLRVRKARGPAGQPPVSRGWGEGNQSVSRHIAATTRRLLRSVLAFCVGSATGTMVLHERVKTALNETRTLILGAQILLGFQYQDQPMQQQG
jgi:hypothetical protein